jgi:alpha-tubulin suppressor-like RCC1 family protein
MRNLRAATVAAVVAMMALSAPASAQPERAADPGATREPATSASPPSAAEESPAPPMEDPVVGRMAAVVTDTRLVARSKPGTGTDSMILGWYLYPRQRAEVLAGPVLAAGYPWYRVRVNDDVGWVAGRSPTGEPWLAKATVRVLAVSRAHACALADSGGVTCWGSDRYGELGDGATTGIAGPVDVVGLSGGVRAIAAGAYHTCAVGDDGGVTCWGLNVHGQLGNGTIADSNAPANVTGLSSGVTAIVAGMEHTCALTGAGGVKCWGADSFGQLGTGKVANYYIVPVDVVGLEDPVIAIAAGAYHTCAITTGGTVACWGYNVYGQLGDGTRTNSSRPVRVAGLDGGVTAIAAGVDHTCAVAADGRVTCWGSNRYGQLGEAAVGATAATAISAGEYHTCALTSGGEVRCWGANSSGQLGDGTDTDRTVPVGPAGLVGGVIAVVAGGARTCAITGAGGVECWGSGTSVPYVGGPKSDNTLPSEVDFSIHQTISLRLAPTAGRIPLGTTKQFTVTVTPRAPTDARPAVRFVFYRYVGTRLVVVTRRDARVAANGQAVLLWKPPSMGRWVVRAWALPNERYQASRLGGNFLFTVTAAR